jgi:hypothetical protein
MVAGAVFVHVATEATHISNATTDIPKKTDAKTRREELVHLLCNSRGTVSPALLIGVLIWAEKSGSELDCNSDSTM